MRDHQAIEDPGEDVKTRHDLAALIGLPPEPKRAPVVVPLPPAQAAPVPISPQPFLDAGAPDPEAKRPPRAGLEVRHFEGMRDTTQAASKLIPTILMLLVLMLSGVVAYRWTRTSPAGQHHVELKLLAPSGATPGALPTEASTMLDFDTEPTGVAVLYAGSIIGRTPFRSPIPVAVREGTGIQLTSPFFQPWIQPAELTPEGELRIRATLAALPSN